MKNCYQRQATTKKNIRKKYVENIDEIIKFDIMLGLMELIYQGMAY